MNWCLIKHKWEYKIENISFFRHTTRSKSNVIMPTKVRLCKKCHKKQRSVGIDWVDWDLTLEEEREIKLKELGI